MLHDPGANRFTGGQFRCCEELAPLMPKPYLKLEKCGWPFSIPHQHHVTRQLPLSDDSAHPETSLYPENVEDFGDWPIILSARAQKDLQEANNVGGATFQITMNKIKCIGKRGKSLRRGIRFINLQCLNETLLS